MMARVRYAWALFRAGLYEKRGLFAAAVSTFCGLSVLAVLTPGMLPSFLAAWHLPLQDIGKVAIGVGFVAGMFGFQSKPPLPRLPRPGEPSLLDDERDA